MDFTGGAMLDVLFKEWARNNPEEASAITNTIGIIETMLNEAAQQLLPIIEGALPRTYNSQVQKALRRNWGCNPDG